MIYQHGSGREEDALRRPRVRNKEDFVPSQLLARQFADQKRDRRPRCCCKGRGEAEEDRWPEANPSRERSRQPLGEDRMPEKKRQTRIRRRPVQMAFRSQSRHMGGEVGRQGSLGGRRLCCGMSQSPGAVTPDPKVDYGLAEVLIVSRSTIAFSDMFHIFTYLDYVL